MANEVKAVEQGSLEWHQQRIGKVTGSRFHDVCRWATGSKSKTAQDYMLELCAEMLTGKAQDEFYSKPTEWGKNNEDEARSWYVIETGNEVRPAPFVDHPSVEGVGCSPDAFVGTEGILEIKCPYNTVNHLRTVVNGSVPEEYIEQVQGNLWVTDRKWCDFISFDPRIPDATIAFFMLRVERDESHISHIEESVIRFRKQTDLMLKNKFGMSPTYGAR